MGIPLYPISNGVKVGFKTGAPLLYELPAPVMWRSFSEWLLALWECKGASPACHPQQHNQSNPYGKLHQQPKCKNKIWNPNPPSGNAKNKTISSQCFWQLPSLKLTIGPEHFGIPKSKPDRHQFSGVFTINFWKNFSSYAVSCLHKPSHIVLHLALSESNGVLPRIMWRTRWHRLTTSDS